MNLLLLVTLFATEPAPYYADLFHLSVNNSRVKATVNYYNENSARKWTRSAEGMGFEFRNDSGTFNVAIHPKMVNLKWSTEAVLWQMYSFRLTQTDGSIEVHYIIRTPAGMSDNNVTIRERTLDDVMLRHPEVVPPLVRIFKALGATLEFSKFVEMQMGERYDLPESIGHEMEPLISQLDDADFKVRENAQIRLDAYGMDGAVYLYRVWLREGMTAEQQARIHLILSKYGYMGRTEMEVYREVKKMIED